MGLIAIAGALIVVLGVYRIIHEHNATHVDPLKKYRSKRGKKK